MQQYLTLEEAAMRLHMSPDELREMAKKKTIRAFQDRGSWRFRAQDIDELARARGAGSEPELPSGGPKSSGVSKKPTDPDRIPVEFSLDDDDDAVPIGREKPDPRSGPRSAAGKSSSRLNPGSDSDVRLVIDDDIDIDLSEDIPAPTPAPSKSSASGGRKSKIHHDSGVNLGKSKSKPGDSGKGGDFGLVTEEIDLDAEEMQAGKNKPDKPGRATPKATQMAGKAPLPTSSPFELSEPDFDLDKPSAKKKGGKAKADTDSSSDFELIAFDKTKTPDDLGSGEIPLLDDDDEISLGSEVSGRNAGASGINLNKPVDSGISLEDADDSLEFELNLDSGATLNPSKSPKSQKKIPAPVDEDDGSEFELSLDGDDSDAPPVDESSEFELSLDGDSGLIDDSSSSEFELSLDAGDEDSATTDGDSEFELTLDEDGGLGVDADADADELFEETNFDVPAMEDDDSGSDVAALDDDTDLEGSDFEIDMDADSESSDSQVVALDDEDDADDAAATVAKPRGKTTKKASAVFDDEDPIDEDSSEVELDPDEAPKGRKGRARDEDEDEADIDEDEDEDEVPAEAAAPAEWGAMPAVMLLPTVVVMFLVGIMGFELLRGMFGYHRATPVGRPVIDTIARMFDDNLPK